MAEGNKCSNACEEMACVPFYLHENAMMHYNRANHRMLIALIVSISVVMIGMFSLGYMFLTSYNEREKGWQEITDRMVQLMEVDNAKETTPP